MYKLKDKYLFFLFWIIAFLVYYPSKDAKFINDSFYYFAKIQQEGFSGIWDSYNIIFNFQLPCIIYYVLYKVFGLHHLGWHIVFSLLHSANAILWFMLIKKSSKDDNNNILYLSTLLFLISPFQTEVVAWGATLHYLLIVFFLISCLLLLNIYNQKKLFRHIFLFHLSYAGALFCFEQAFLFPILFLLYIIIVQNNDNYKSYGLKIFLPNIIMIIFYVFLTKYIYGVYIAHYGEDVHTNLNLYNMYNTFILYLYKFIFLFRYIPTSINYVLEYEWIKIIFLISCIILLLITYKKTNTKKIFLFLVLGYGLMIFPVLNLDTSFKFEIQSDRYGYLPSIFAYTLIIYIIFTNFRLKIATIFSIFIILINLLLLIPTIDKWSKAGKYAIDLLKNFPLEPNQKCYVLNLPDNYRGAYMFRNSLDYGLYLYKGKGYSFNNIRNIAQVNIFSNKNETDVVKLSDRNYQVTNSRIGKWYYRNGSGATNATNECYSINFDKWLNRYWLTIKEKSDSNIYVLQCTGTDWKIVDTVMANK